MILPAEQAPRTLLQNQILHRRITRDKDQTHVSSLETFAKRTRLAVVDFVLVTLAQTPSLTGVCPHLLPPSNACRGPSLSLDISAPRVSTLPLPSPHTLTQTHFACRRDAAGAHRGAAGGPRGLGGAGGRESGGGGAEAAPDARARLRSAAGTVIGRARIVGLNPCSPARMMGNTCDKGQVCKLRSASLLFE